VAEAGGFTMSLKKLKDYKLTFKELKAACTELNDSELADPIVVKVGTKGEVMLVAFLDAVDSISKKKVKNIPANVSAFYDGLSQEVFDDADDDDATADDADATADDADATADDDDDATADDDDDATADDDDDATADDADATADDADAPDSDCPTFLTGWDDGEDDCQECKKEYKDEYTACKKATKKAAKADAKKKPAGNKAPGKRTRYGHVLGSMNEDVDNMLWKGAKREAIVAVLVKTHKREERLAVNKVSGHIAHLKNNRGITVTENKKGILKADKEFSKGYDKDNTVTK